MEALIKDSNEFECEDKKDFFSLKNNKILCIHCLRTKENGIRCKGMCVADNEY